MQARDAIRNKRSLYPNFNAEIDAIDESGISNELINKIIKKHRPNAKYNEKLYERYKCIKEGVPIFDRHPRFPEDEDINNTVNNNFFGECIDFEVGYFAGKPFSYGYSETEESENETGGTEAVKTAKKVITDFVTRNNMHNVDMECTKMAAICGYSGRLFYIDEEGNERAMFTPASETIVLSKTSITEPAYAIHYFPITDINGKRQWYAEFYDNKSIRYFKGSYGSLEEYTPNGEPTEHCFDYCPLQGIPNNEEETGSVESVIALIDSYDKIISDNANDIEAFANAYMVFENGILDEKQAKEMNQSGIITFRTTGTGNGRVYYLTKDINASFSENQLKTLENNIYRFTHTPNLRDENMGSSSGQALKHRLLGLETKCGIKQAKFENAFMYMCKVLASSWAKKQIKIDPLQCTIEFSRNFPLDVLGEAQAAQALVALGYPLKLAIEAALSWVDDADYVMNMIEAEKEKIPSLFDSVDENEEQGEDEQSDDEPNAKETPSKAVRGGQRNCVTCGRSFVASTDTQRYCSRKCALKHRNKNT
ncbi:MAG: phage portal protein [Ruminococcus sp.]|nr:phage portal protein [Ruminococcus sp.]